MKSLLIETSTEEGICALYSHYEELFYSELLKGFQHSRFLIAEIERGFLKEKISLKDLSFIAIGAGPGSYTGIRVGAMTAKTLSWASKVPLVPITYLEGIAPLEDGPFFAALDAKISGAYVLFGVKKGELIEYAIAPEVLSLEALSLRASGTIQVVSPHAKILEKKWHDKQLKGEVQWIERGADSSLLIKRAADRFQQGMIASDRTLELLYLR